MIQLIRLKLKNKVNCTNKTNRNNETSDYSISCAIFNSTTGKTYYDTLLREKQYTCFDYINEITHVVKSTESIVYFRNIEEEVQRKIQGILEEKNIPSRHFVNAGQENKLFMWNKDFQRKILETTFERFCYGYDIFQSLELEYNNLLMTNLTSLYMFIRSHDSELLQNIATPQKLFEEESKVYLLNNVYKHLDIFTDNGIEDLLKIQYTNMGKRYLNTKLSNPTSDCSKLQKSYRMIEEFQNLESHTRAKIGQCLKNIHDIEVLYRRIGIGSIWYYVGL